MQPFTIDDLKLAFIYDLVRSIVTADDNVKDTEDAFLAGLCPPEHMRAAGFWNEMWQTTERYEHAFAEALEVLPDRPLAERWILLDGCLEACIVDEYLDPREADYLRRAAILLGLTDDQFDHYLDGHPAVGRIATEELEPE
jgi:uncharacterized tellurite resistance protein B-like protein